MTVTAVVGGRVVPISDPVIETGTVVIEDGRITAVRPDVAVPDGAEVVDASGCWVLPGLIDAHTHLGVHEEGEGPVGNDTNEMTDPVTAQVRALDAILATEEGWRDAVEGGVLTVGVNPGSGNPIGGQCLAIRTTGGTVDERVLLAPCGMKSALGENPKRVYGEQKKMPSTRLGVAAVIRQALADAQDYAAKQQAGAGDDGVPPKRDLKLEALAKVLAREIPWRQHCHRADDIATAIRISEEFGYSLVLDHGTEAHKLAEQIAAKGIPVLIGPLLTSRSKVEVRDRHLRNPGLLDRAGVEISLITDHPVIPIHLLIVQAALCVKEGLDRDAALRAVTINPARVLGVADRVGSLEVGKDADLCLWSGDPLDPRERVVRALVQGRGVFVHDGEPHHLTDA